MRQLFAVLLCFGIILFYSCKNTKGINESEKTQFEEASEVMASPEILLVLFSVNQLDSIAIKETYINYGIYRGSEKFQKDAWEGDLKISFLDQDGELCMEEVVSNPLLKKAEYLIDDESGRLAAEAVELEESSFFVRLQWRDCFYQVKIERLDEGEWKFLKQIRLSKPANP